MCFAKLYEFSYRRPRPLQGGNKCAEGERVPRRTAAPICSNTPWIEIPRALFSGCFEVPLPYPMQYTIHGRAARSPSCNTRCGSIVTRVGIAPRVGNSPLQLDMIYDMLYSATRNSRRYIRSYPLLILSIQLSPGCRCRCRFCHCRCRYKKVDILDAIFLYKN